MKQRFSFLTAIAVLFSLNFLNAQGEILPKSFDFCQDDCPCNGAFTQIQLYYFGDDNVKVEAFANGDLSGLVGVFNGVASGQLLTVSASGLPGGAFTQYVYLRVTKPDGSSCVTRIYARCPTNAWPGALDDLRILGKTYGSFTVFSHTDQSSAVMCDLSSVEQDWHVGGNVISSGANTLGTKNNESMVIITNNTPRGVVTHGGNFGIGTTSPASRLDVSGNARISEELRVAGQIYAQNNTESLSPTSGAVIVAGGLGVGRQLNVGANLSVSGTGHIGSNLSVGANLDVDGMAAIGSDLIVEPAGFVMVQNNADASSPNSGALMVAGGAGIGQTLYVGADIRGGNDGSVARDFNVGRDLRVEHDAYAVGNLAAGQQLTVGQDATIVRSASVGDDLSVGRDVFAARNANVGLDLYVVRDGSINRNLSVAQNARVMGRMQVGGSATPTGYIASFDGRVICEELRVRNSTNWPDYVFADAYPLLSLEALETYIATHKHLPGIPSAATIESEAGFDLGEIQRLQMEKIEELTLYAIALDKENAQIKRQMAEMNDLLHQALEQLSALQQK
ncbi:MAG: hypothetical protein ACK4NS_13340 [Saprospiraceae bacterium]